MSCNDFFQPFIDYLNQPTDPEHINRLAFLLAGNRAETSDNHFVLYMQGYFEQGTDFPAQLTGAATQFFSNKSAVTSGVEQPFDVHLSQDIAVSLTVPDGPITFLERDTGNVIEQFSTLECHDNGFLLCTSDSGHSLLVLSFTESFLDLND